MLVCPLCGEELEYHDYYGRLCKHQDGKVLGQIYHCPKGRQEDNSCESENFNGTWHTREGSDELREGYPC